jgi:hypothetical protein
MDTSGFYKLTNDGWLYAPNFVYAKDYTLEREGNKESIDGWQWYDTEPIEFTIWKIKQDGNI